LLYGYKGRKYGSAFQASILTQYIKFYAIGKYNAMSICESPIMDHQVIRHSEILLLYYIEI